MPQDKTRVNVVMPTELYDRFQHALFEMGRRKKGAISDSICEALEEWLNVHDP